MEATAGIRRSVSALARSEPLSGAYFWLLIFFFVYCARPEDWIPGLGVLPVAKISGALALLALVLSLGRSASSVRRLPREVFYLLALDLYLLVSALLSPIWKGGAVGNALDFSKALIAVVLTVLAVTSLERLRRLILVQTGSVILISAVSIVKGHGQSRLQSILNGIYGNPNDLAFAIAIILPFCFALMLSTRSILQRMAWAGAMLIATAALLLTGSRGGFITLCVAGAFCLWRFAVKGKRPLIVLASVTVAVLLFVFAGNSLRQRFNAMSGENISNEMQGNAYGSYEQRWFVIKESLAQIKHHPVFGLGVGNFQVVSGSWHDVHVAYLQIASEGGIPALILFLMFFWRGFANLRRVAQTPGVDADTRLVSTAVQGSLIGYAIGALFAPEAYQYFPLFGVAYTSVLLSLAKAQPEAAGSPAKAGAKGPWRRLSVYSAPAKQQPAVLAR